jgi:hypothetical protein
VGEPLKKNVLEPPEPKGKLDAETVNGPEDETLDWDTIVWAVHEENVRRLRQRIFKATKEQDLATVRNLQRMTAAELVEHADQRAAGDAAQRWSRNPRGRRAGRADRPGEDGPGRAGAPHSTVLPAPASPPSVHTEGQWKTKAARNSRDN